MKINEIKLSRDSQKHGLSSRMSKTLDAKELRDLLHSSFYIGDMGKLRIYICSYDNQVIGILPTGKDKWIIAVILEISTKRRINAASTTLTIESIAGHPGLSGHSMGVLLYEFLVSKGFNLIAGWSHYYGGFYLWSSLIKRGKVHVSVKPFSSFAGQLRPADYDEDEDDIIFEYEGTWYSVYNTEKWIGAAGGYHTAIGTDDSDTRIIKPLPRKFDNLEMIAHN